MAGFERLGRLAIAVTTGVLFGAKESYRAVSARASIQGVGA
jgi:hypothetical protein